MKKFTNEQLAAFQECKTKEELIAKANELGIEYSEEDLNEAVELLANPPEQIFVEKLKSLLRFGSASTRFKDIYDMCYLLGMLNRDLLNTYLKLYIYDDALMRENVLSDIEKRLHRVFGDKSFIRALSNPTNAWLDVPTDKATSELLSFLSSLA